MRTNKVVTRGQKGHRGRRRLCFIGSGSSFPSSSPSHRLVWSCLLCVSTEVGRGLLTKRHHTNIALSRVQRGSKVKTGRGQRNAAKMVISAVLWSIDFAVNVNAAVEPEKLSKHKSIKAYQWYWTGLCVLCSHMTRSTIRATGACFRQGFSAMPYCLHLLQQMSTELSSRCMKLAIRFVDRAYAVLFIPHNTILNDCVIKSVIRAVQDWAPLPGFLPQEPHTSFSLSSYYMDVKETFCIVLNLPHSYYIFIYMCVCVSIQVSVF